MNSKIPLGLNLYPLIGSFGGQSGPLGNLHRKLNKEVWQAHKEATGHCAWQPAWEDILSIFAEEFSKEEE